MSVAAAVGRWRAVRQCIVFHFLSGQLSSLRPAQTLTVYAPFSIIVWVFSYPDIGSKNRYPDFRISIINTTSCDIIVFAARSVVGFGLGRAR